MRCPVGVNVALQFSLRYWCSILCTVIQMVFTNFASGTYSQFQRWNCLDFVDDLAIYVMVVDLYIQANLFVFAAVLNFMAPLIRVHKIIGWLKQTENVVTMQPHLGPRSLSPVSIDVAFVFVCGRSPTDPIPVTATRWYRRLLDATTSETSTTTSGCGSSVLWMFSCLGALPQLLISIKSEAELWVLAGAKRLCCLFSE